MSRLAEIYLNEKSAGRGLGSALGKRFLEKADPRRMFDQSGLLATMLPSLFKSYSATSGGKRNVSSLGGRGSSINSPSFSIIGVESKLDDIYISNKMIAKNSMVLPSMHRDINLMRQNISKLVKLQGGNPASKADMFFTRAKDREAQYESQFKKEKSTTGKSASGATSAGGGGLLNMIFGGLGKIGEGIGTGAKIGAIGLGIAGFIGSVGFASKFVDAQKLKDVLVAIGTGLGSFNMQTLVSLGSLVAAGTLFGAVAAFPGGMGKSIKGSIGTSMGMTAIGVGLAGFVGAIGLVAESIDIKKFSDLMMAISTSLNSFNTSSLVALGGLLAAGGIFGAVTAVNPLMGILGSLGTTMGITAIGWGLSSFIKTMAETVVFAEKLGVGNSIANLIIQVSKGLEALSNLNGTNIANVGTGLAGLGTGLLALFGAKGLGAVEDTWIKVKKFFFPDSGDKKGFFDELIPELKKLETIDSKKIKEVGDGFKNLVDSIKELTRLTDSDVDKVLKITNSLSGGFETNTTQNIQRTSFGSYNTTPSKINTSQQSMADLIRRKFKAAGFSDAQAEAAVINAFAESSFNPNAMPKNGEKSVGLFQLNMTRGEGVGYTESELKDANKNIDITINKMKNIKSFREATTVEDAVKSMIVNFERPEDIQGAITKRIGMIGSIPGSTNSAKVGKITSKFGEKRGKRLHKGIDVGGGLSIGIPIYATQSGKVLRTGYHENGYGHFVEIKHDDGTTSLYAHMNEPSPVKSGDTIFAGQRIGGIGNSGTSTGPHLHFEMRKNGKAFQPGEETALAALNPSMLSNGSILAQNSTQVASEQRQQSVTVVPVVNSQTPQTGQQSAPPAQLMPAEVMDSDLMRELFRKRPIHYSV